jgi:hypothetical protein
VPPKALYPIALPVLLTLAACGESEYEPLGPADIGYDIEGEWAYAAEMTRSGESQVEWCRATDTRIRFTMGKPEGWFGGRALGGVVASGSLECVVAGAAITVPLAGAFVTGDAALLSFTFWFTAAHPVLGPVEVTSSWLRGMDPDGSSGRWEGHASVRLGDPATGQVSFVGSWEMSLVGP